MKTLILPAGATVHVQGIPFRLTHQTTLEGHPANIAMLTEEPKYLDIGCCLDNMKRPWWVRMFRRVGGRADG